MPTKLTLAKILKAKEIVALIDAGGPQITVEQVLHIENIDESEPTYLETLNLKHVPLKQSGNPPTDHAH